MKKYLEALPSCVEAALTDHYEVLDFDKYFAKAYALPLPTLAYALAQIGEINET